MRLTIAYTTARAKPMFHWFVDSLFPQIEQGDEMDIIFVDEFPERKGISCPDNMGINPSFATVNIRWTRAKPNIWSGEHRLPKQQWWSVCASRNTAICLAKCDFIVFVDDRSVLSPGWLDSIRKAQLLRYAVCGAFEKFYNMVVDNGKIVSFTEPKGAEGNFIGKDSRELYVNSHWKGQSPVDAPGEWSFGCSFALPLEWLLQVNGYPEDWCDSLSFEDSILGLCLQNNHFPIKYDLRMRIAEDRTPGETRPDIKRTDKGVSPRDKSHKVLEMVRTTTRFPNHFGDIRELRRHVQSGHPFPPPQTIPEPRDFYDGQLVKDFWKD